MSFKRIARLCLCCLFLLRILSSCSKAEDMDYIDFLMRMKLNDRYEEDLLKMAGSRSLAERWEIMSTGENDRIKASQSFTMTRYLLEGKEISRLDEVSGFITENSFLDLHSFPPEPGISKQLVLLQVSLASMASLCRIGEPESLGLAQEIFLSLEKTDVMRSLPSLNGGKDLQVLSEHFSTSRALFEKVFKGDFT